MKTLSQVLQEFNDTVRAEVIAACGEGNSVAMSQAWNDYTDSECKSGNITSLQYNHCPSDDGMASYEPDDMGSEIAWLLEQMDVKMTCVKVAKRKDGLMSDSSTHWQLELCRVGKSLTTYFSQGSAHTGEPKITDVFYCLFSDYSLADNNTFEEFANEMGFDTDSRKAEATYKACQAIIRDMNFLFNKSEIDDLQELYSDY